MDDDHWTARGGGQRQRPTGGNPGPNPGQRPAPPRPPNATGSIGGRPSGGLNTSGGSPYNAAPGSSRPVQRPGNSGSLPRLQGVNGWDAPDRSIPPQRRGPSGPMNGAGGNGRGPNNSYPLPPGGGSTRSGSIGPADRRSGGFGNQDQRGRGAQTGQWNNTGRGWDDEDDDPRSGRGRQGRAPSGQVGPGARGAQGRPGGPQKGQGRAANTTIRGNWVVETDAKGGSSTGNSLRKRLLMLLLAAVVVLGGVVVLVPSVRHRIESYLPGAKPAQSNQAAPTTPGTLTVQVNVPSATVKVDTQQQNTQAGQTAPFSSVTFTKLTAGKHTLTIHADKYTDYSGPLTLPTSGATLTVWLAPTADTLTALGTQFGTPAVQPDAGKAGDHYSATKTATGALTVGVTYEVGGLTATSFADQSVSGSDTKTSPFKPVALTLTPVFTFKNAAGTTLLTTNFTALPATQFGVSVIPTVDAKGNAQLTAQSVVLTAGGQNIKTTFTGPAARDYALFFAIASVFTTAPAALNLTCIGAVDNQKFNPEDGLFIVDTADDTTHAHYFYRWGMLWATNAVAHTLTPNAPMAVAGSNEFNDANTARTNASCGTA